MVEVLRIRGGGPCGSRCGGGGKDGVPAYHDCRLEQVGSICIQNPPVPYRMIGFFHGCPFARYLHACKTFFRPEKRNCVNTETAEKLKTAFQEFENDENMYCCVLHGLGRSHNAFLSHYLNINQEFALSLLYPSKLLSVGTHFLNFHIMGHNFCSHCPPMN